MVCLSRYRGLGTSHKQVIIPSQRIYADMDRAKY